jgi:hypothetical protein
MRHNLGNKQKKFLEWVHQNYPNTILNFAFNQYQILESVLEHGDYLESDRDSLNQIRIGYIQLYDKSVTDDWKDKELDKLIKEMDEMEKTMKSSLGVPASRMGEPDRNYPTVIPNNERPPEHRISVKEQPLGVSTKDYLKNKRKPKHDPYGHGITNYFQEKYNKYKIW